MPIEDGNRQQYRRGLALGFTLAELFTILLFLLLLIFAAVRQSEMAHAREQESKNQKLVEGLQRAKQEAQALVERSDSPEMAVSPDQFDDLFRDLVLSKKENEQLHQQINGLSEKAKEDEKFRKALAANNLTSVAPEEVVRDAKSAEDAQKALGKSGLAAQSKGARPLDLIKSVGALVNSEETLQGQVANLTRRCGGGGTEMPPCWVTRNGEIEFFADVELRSDGSGGTIAMFDDAVPGHEEERKSLFSDLKFGQPLTESEFLDQTEALYDFGESQKPQCRFFVRVVDHTGPEDKEIFKSLLHTVEQHFYKKLI